MDAKTLSNIQRVISGLLLVTFTVLPIVVIIAFWPDQLPEVGKSARYSYQNFSVRLVESSFDGKVIHLNTLFFILVASSGFLGNMIHIATSFATFVGAGKFDQKWLLWYIVKPFSAAGLAIVVYFAFRAGLLSESSESAGSINLYGIMSFAVLTGLFADLATQKLEEVFKVVFKPYDNRPGKLNTIPKIAKLSPDNFTKGVKNPVVIDGENLNLNEIEVFVGGIKMENPTKSPSNISFEYTLPADAKDTIEIKVTYPNTTKAIFTKQVAAV